MENVHHSYAPMCDPCDRTLIEVHDPERAPPRATKGPSIFRVFSSPWMLGLLWIGSLVPVFLMASHPMLRTVLLGMVGPILLLPVLMSLGFLTRFGFEARELRALLSKEMRVVHGLEHATLKILEERGFEISGGFTKGETSFLARFPSQAKRLTPSVLKRALRSAVQRVQAGEKDLVYDRRCGTSLLVGVGLMALLGVAAGVVGLSLTLPLKTVLAIFVAAVLLPVLTMRRLGLLAQRLFTVSPRFSKASLARVVRRPKVDDLEQFEIFLRVAT